MRRVNYFLVVRKGIPALFSIGVALIGRPISVTIREIKSHICPGLYNKGLCGICLKIYLSRKTVLHSSHIQYKVVKYSINVNFSSVIGHIYFYVP